MTRHTRRHMLALAGTAGMLAEVLVVQAGQQIELSPLIALGHTRRSLQIEHRIALGSE